MNLILHIDTAIDTASICLAANGELIDQDSNDQQKDHAAWIHNAIKLLMQKSGYKMQQLNAVAVSAGPGSYTGLRVGMASAKGICYALQIPMISLSTLEIMAKSAKNKWGNMGMTRKLLFVPMIDARRMEVFTAVYDDNINPLLSPQAMIPDENSFNTWINGHNMLFFGNGYEKCKTFMQHPNAIFDHINFGATDMVKLAFSKYQSEIFEDLAYTEPFYTKEFYTSAKKLILPEKRN